MVYLFTGVAWLSSVPVVKYQVKSGKEQNPSERWLLNQPANQYQLVLKGIKTSPHAPDRLGYRRAT